MRSRLLNILFIGITIGSESIYLYKGNDQSLVICSLLIISTLCIALAGYLDNDYHDQKIDRINGKEGVIASKNAIYLLYSSGTALGMLYGWIQSQGVWIESLLDGLFFLLPTILLLLYASTLSRNKGIGNIVVAGLCCYSLALPALLTRSVTGDYWIALTPFVVVLFLSSYIREIAKDAEDIKGDKALNRTTLPLVLGDFFSRFYSLLGLMVLALVLLGFGFYYQYTKITIVLASYLLIYFVTYFVRQKTLTWRQKQQAWKGFIALGVLLRILFLHTDIL